MSFLFSKVNELNQSIFSQWKISMFGILELQNRVMKSSYAKWRHTWVTNSKGFIEILFSSYLLDFAKHQIRISKLKLKENIHLQFHFELLKWKFLLRATNSKLKNKMFHLFRKIKKKKSWFRITVNQDFFDELKYYTIQNCLKRI